MKEYKTASGLFCIDGRAHDAAIVWAKERFGAEKVDMMTAPGMDGVLALGKEVERSTLIESDLKLSIHVHSSLGVILVGHEGCAGNPVSKEEHCEHTKKACDLIRNSWGIKIPVVGLWIDENEEVGEVVCEL